MIGISYTNELWLAVVAVATVVFLGLRLFRITQTEREQQRRLEAFRGPITISPTTQVVPWYRQLVILIAAGPILGTTEQQRLLKLLARAGIKGHGSLASFILMKTFSAVVFAVLVWTFLEWRHILANTMWLRVAIVGFGGLLIGWRLPDYVVHHLVKRRRLRFEQGMPDALDLLVVCSEAGLSLNQSIEEISRQLRVSNSDVADEFSATSAEMQVLPDFSEALDNMVERTGLDDLRSLMATLKQSLKFGTPLAESLRMIASEMRAARTARIEERAARLPVILAIPMMMFILPCVLMVVGTPVALRILDVFKNVTIGGSP